MSVLNFSKNRGKLYCIIKRMQNKHKRGHTHIIKLGIGDKKVVYCLQPSEVLELRDQLLQEFPLTFYPNQQENIK